MVVLEEVRHERQLLKKKVSNFQGSQSALMLLPPNPSLSIFGLLLLLCCFAILQNSFLERSFDLIPQKIFQIIIFSS